MPEKKCGAQRKKALEDADSALDEIDKALAENTWHGSPPRRLRRSRVRKPLDTPQPEPDVGS